MTRLATSWLVYRLTGSEVLLGVAGFAGQIPAFLLSPGVGVWADRWNRHRTLVLTQVLSMVQSLALAALTLTGAIRVWHIVALALAQGVINAFEIPVRQSLVVEMVDRREDLSNAIALNASMVNAARLVGPAIAGFIIAAAGEGVCFLVDGFSYVAVIASLLTMRLRTPPERPPARPVLEELREGWTYVTGSVPIRTIVVFLGLVSLVGMPYSVLMPVFASDVLGGGPRTLGFLTAASGIGALAGAVGLTLRASVLGLGRRIMQASAMFGGALMVFAFSRNLWLSLLALTIGSFGMMQHMAASNTILQTVVEDSKRGRVMAYYSMAFQGMMPFGSLAAGALAAQIGAPGTVAIGGLACLLGSLWYWRRLPQIRAAARPIYTRLGILTAPAVSAHSDAPPESGAPPPAGGGWA